MAMTEDLTAFFSTAEFAVQTTLAGVVVRGIFDNAYVLADVGGAGMACTQPTLTLSTASVPASPVGLPLVVGSAQYLITAHEPDGTGISVLLLEAAA